MKHLVKYIASLTLITLLVLGSIKSEGSELKASSLEVVETTLQLENWMTSETTWGINTFYNVEFAPTAETELELEIWMISNDIWTVEETEMETGLVLENWMINDNVWK